MWSSEIFPVVSVRTHALLVEQPVDPDGAARRRPVLGQDAADELPRARDAADDPRARDVGEDRRVPRRVPPDRADPVQRVPPLEELQVTGAEGEAADEIAAAPGQHPADVAEVLRPRRPDVRAVL